MIYIYRCMQCRLWLNSSRNQWSAGAAMRPYLAPRSDWLAWKNSTVYLWLRFITVTSWIVKATDLAQTPRLHSTPQHTSSTSTATTMGEQRQQQQRVKLWVHFVLSRGGGDRSKEATASMQSPSLRCYINLIQKRRHAAHASYSWVYSYVNDGSRRSWRRLQMEEEEQEEEAAHTSKT